MSATISNFLESIVGVSSQLQGAETREAKRAIRTKLSSIIHRFLSSKSVADRNKIMARSFARLDNKTIQAYISDSMYHPRPVLAMIQRLLAPAPRTVPSFLELNHTLIAGQPNWEPASRDIFVRCVKEAATLQEATTSRGDKMQIRNRLAAVVEKFLVSKSVADRNAIMAERFALLGNRTIQDFISVKVFHPRTPLEKIQSLLAPAPAPQPAQTFNFYSGSAPVIQVAPRTLRASLDSLGEQAVTILASLKKGKK